MWKKFIAFGDSVTAGVGDSVPGMEMRGWADWVADHLSSLEPTFSYTNLGKRGYTTVDVLQNQLAAVLKENPDVVSITTGGNDARLPEWNADTFMKNYEEVLQPLVNNGVSIITLAYPDLRTAISQSGNEIPRSWRLYFQRMKTTNAIIREVSQRFGACLLDFEEFEPAQNPANISKDLVHPNARGYKFAGETAIQILQEKFNLPQPA